MCPGSSEPFYIASLLYKIGHYFLNILYNEFGGIPKSCGGVRDTHKQKQRKIDMTTNREEER